VLKRGFLAAALAALVVPSFAVAGTTTLVPGVTYERQVRLIGGSGVVLHILRAPRHGGLYWLRPVLSNGTVLGRETVPTMERRVSRRATVAGVNGDFFRFDTGQPTSVFMRNGVLANRPHPKRSSLGIAFDGRLVVDRFFYSGSWQAAGHTEHPLEEFNRLLSHPPGVALYTPRWGGVTPRRRTARDVVLTSFPRVLPNGYQTGKVVGVRRGGGTTVPRGGAVLQARGSWSDVLVREARPGTLLTVHVGLRNLPLDVADAIGGGPLLVRDGQPIVSTDEAFTAAHVTNRHPRTAVGQLADGRVIMVVADGRSSASAGLTMGQLAQEMTRLGAVTAMSFDGGGSSTMAFDGRVLNRPSDGVPRPVADGLFVFYYGVYAPPAPRGVISPNGDGVIDSQTLRAKIVRRSRVNVRLVRPNGTVAWRYRAQVRPGWISRPVGPTGMANGRWRWVAGAVELDSGRRSRMGRSFTVNKTLGFLTLSKQRMRVVVGHGGRLDVSVNVTQPARLTVTVRNAAGAVRRVLHSGDVGRGRLSWRWDGRNKWGGVVWSGLYTVSVRARNALGAVSLRKHVRVVRIRPS
jgi:phosphodiester glycosidase/flagellar hook capping protein FlgD